MSARRIAVIGGGVTGLAAANRLRELDPASEVVLYEASGRLGGVIETQQRDGYLLEQSADSFITTAPHAVDLCRRLGLADELIKTNEVGRRAMIVHRGRLEAVPEGFLLLAPRRYWPLITSPILSWAGKLRLLGEYFVPKRTEGGDESLADFARRRLGREAYERLVQPLVGGIYTADAEKLSIHAALPRFVAMEQKHGSLIRALRRQAANGDVAHAAGARYSMFVTPRLGLSQLIDALAKRLPPEAIRLNSPVKLIELIEDRWQVTASNDQSQFDAVILALPAPRASQLAARIDPALAADLGKIAYAGCAIALAGYRREQISHPLDGFGFVVPEIERRRILACSFSSLKFPGRAADGRVLLRVFVGGANHPEQNDLSDEQIKQIVVEELGDLIGARGEPELFQVARWHGAMPQYHLGHCKLVAKIEAQAARLPNFALAGNAYHGVGIPDCIKSGEQAAEQFVVPPLGAGGGGTPRTAARTA